MGGSHSGMIPGSSPSNTDSAPACCCVRNVRIPPTQHNAAALAVQG